MRYFIIGQDETCIDAPKIMNWFDVLDVRKIRRGQSHAIPYRMVLDIQPSEDTYFTDIVSKPFFLCTEVVKEAVKIYESDIIHKQIMLYDLKNRLSELYFLPILDIVDCLSDKSELNRDRSVIHRAVLDESRLPDSTIFRLGGVNSTYIVARLDLVESILRRGVKGISLKEVEIA